MKPLHSDQPTCPHQGSILEAVSVWEAMAPARAPSTHGHLLMDSLAVLPLLILLSAPGCSHPPPLQPHRDSPGEMMTPSSCEIQLCINWIPWENTVQYQLVPERATGGATPLEWYITCPLHTGTEPQSHSQAWYPRDVAEGAWWQKGKWIKASSSQPGEGLPAKVHLVLGVRINQVNITAALQSAPASAK